MSKSTTAPTAAVVREFFRADEKRLDRLTPEARKTVETGARGRLHPQVIKGYNKGRKPERQYVLGAGKAAKSRAAEHREALRAQGISVGARGPLPKVNKEQASVTKS